MSALTTDKHRNELLNRLKRAEGQLRGVQRMVEEGQPCLDLFSQMTAVRKALDSACVHMTMCYMGQELESRLHLDEGRSDELAGVLEDVQALLGKFK